MPDAPKVVALIATRFRSDLLTRLLESLHRQTVRPLAAVVCDNGPDASTAEACQNSPFPCEIVSPGMNLGFGGGLAVAAQRAFDKFPDLTHLLVVDDDAILSPQDLESLLASAAQHSAGTVAPYLVNASGKLREVPEPVSWPLARAFHAVGQNLDQARALAPGGYPMAWCIGPCLLVGRFTWLRAGPPRSDMLAYGDDVEFSLRLSAVSPAWAEPSVTVFHDPPAAERPPSEAPHESSRLGAKEGRPLHLHPNRGDPAHYRKFGMLLQNLAFSCVASPRPRHLPLYLFGNAKRFLRTFGAAPANYLEVARRFFLGFLGRPAGIGS